MITVVGLSHKTAPIEVRERLALSSEQGKALLDELISSGTVGEALLLSTCNRVELYAAPEEGREADLGPVLQEATLRLTRACPEVRPHLYQYTGNAAIRHLFRVAASLDSLVLGEPQILGQLKQAYELSQRAGSVGNSLHRAMSRALRTAKRVRTETNIGSGNVSVPSVAVELTRQVFGELTGKSALLVGSGEMAEAVARLMRAGGAKLQVVGRNTDRTEQLAGAVGGQPRLWAELGDCLREADVVITSTSAPHHVVSREAHRDVLRARRGRTLFFIDLAVPRDVDPGLDTMEGVFLYNIDDLSKVVSESLEARKQEAARGEQLVEMEALQFDRWAEALQVTPTIVSLRERLRQVLDEELKASLRSRLKHLGPEDREALFRMQEAAVNKLMHAPSTLLKRAAADPALEEATLEQLVDSLKHLFQLDERASLRPSPSSPSRPPVSSPSAAPEASVGDE